MSCRVFVGLFLTAAVTAAPLAGFAQSVDTGAVPQTPWGDPDLQGIWEY